MTSSERWKTLVCFVLVYLAALSGSATEIRLRPRVDSQGSVVLLGDIAILKTDKPTSGRTTGGRRADVESLARLELFPAPGVSRSRTIRRREVRELLSLHGVDLRDVSFTGAESVVIRSSKRPILRKVTPATNPPRVTTYQPFRNARPIALANMQEVVPATEVVLALLHGVRRGEIIRQSNVTRIRLPISGQGSAASMGIVQPALMTEAVIGMEATRTIAANQPLDARSLKPRIVVKRNDLVTVTSFAPGVRVETRARAIESGAVGDLVRLQSSNRQGTYTANVTGEKTATVYAGGVKVSSPPARQRQFNFSSQPQRRAAQ